MGNPLPPYQKAAFSASFQSLSSIFPVPFLYLSSTFSIPFLYLYQCLYWSLSVSNCTYKDRAVVRTEEHK